MLNEYGNSLFRPWVSVQNIVLFMALAYMVFLGIRLYDLGPSDIASWVQAVGSIVSIWGAFAISRDQSKKAEIKEDKLKKEKELAYISVRISAATAARELSELVERKPSAEDFRAAWGAHHEHFISSYITALGMVPMHELGGASQVSAHIHVASALKNMHSTVCRYLNDEKWFEDDPHALYGNIEMLYRWQDFQVKLADNSFLE